MTCLGFQKKFYSTKSGGFSSSVLPWPLEAKALWMVAFKESGGHGLLKILNNCPDCRASDPPNSKSAWPVSRIHTVSG